MPYIKLPNGQYGKIPEGLTDEQALAFAKDKAPRAFLEPGELEERQGFGAATKQAFKEFKASTESGLGALLNNETLKGWGAEDKKAAEENSFLPTTSQETSRAWKQGLLPGASSFLSQYVTEPVGGIVGRYGPVMAAQTIPYVGQGISAALDLPAEVQENLERQKELGQKENINKALGFGLLQASLAGFGLPGTGALPNMLNKVLGKEASALGEKVLAGNITKEAALEKLHGTVYNVVKGTGVNALTGTAMMVGTEAARRASANQDITGTDAFNAYKENAIGALELSPIFGALHGIPQKGGQKRQIETAAGKRAETIRAEETAKADEQARIQAEAAQQAELQKQQQETGNLFGDVPLQEGVKSKKAIEGAVSSLISKPELFKTGLNKDNEPTYGVRQAVPETRTVAEREAEANKPPEITPQEIFKQHDTLKKYVDELQDKVAKAAANGNLQTLSSLSPQLINAQKALVESTNRVKQTTPIEQSPEIQAAELKGKLTAQMIALKKAGDLGDFESIAKINAKINEIQGKLKELPQGEDLIGQSERLKKEAVEKEAEHLQQQQEDLFAQAEATKPKATEVIDETKVKTAQEELDKAYAENKDPDEIYYLIKKLNAEQNKFKNKKTKAEYENQSVIDRYQQGLQDLEDAHAAGASERLINNLVDNLRRASLEKEASRTLNVSGEEIENQVQRVERVKRALKEAEDTYSSAKSDEEKTDALKNVRALQDRFATAQAERAQGRPEIAEKEAYSNQEEAKLDAVETVRQLLSGEYFNSKNVDVASSMKPQLENKIINAGKAYSREAVNEINAVRAQKKIKQEALSTDDALKLVTRLQGRFNYLAKNPDYLADRATKLRQDLGVAEQALKNATIPEIKTQLTSKVEGLKKQIDTATKEQQANLKTFEESLERIKKDFFKGKSKVQRGPEILRQERNPIEMLRIEQAKKKPNPRFVEGLKREIETGKKENERLAAEKEKAKIKEPEGVNPDQFNLFGEKELEPIATVRATPKNFKRLVDTVGARFDLAKTQAETMLKKAEAQAKAKDVKWSKPVDKQDLAELTQNFKEQRALVEQILNVDKFRKIAKNLWENSKDSDKTKIIDVLYARANTFAKENLALEQAILRGLENKLAAIKDPTSAEAKRVLAEKNKARSEIGKTEAEIKTLLEEKVKLQRETEERQAKELNKLPSKRQEIIETNRKAPGAELNTTRKQIIEKRVPKTETEKIDEVKEIAAEGARQMAELKKMQSPSLKLKEVQKVESILKKDLRARKEEIQKNVKNLVKLETAVKNAKSEKGKAHWQEKVDALNKKIEEKNLGGVVDVLEKNLKLLKGVGVDVENAMAILGNLPGRTERKKPLKTGTSKVEKDFKEAINSEKHGYGPNHDPYEGPSGNRYRLTDTADNKMDIAEGRKFIDKLEKKLPKDVKLTYVDEFKDLPAEEKATLARDGIIEGTDATKAFNGFVNGKGEVFIIGGNHASLKDLETTYAHELIGHVGVDRILGKKGMKLLTDRINAQDGGVYELAKKLGIDKEIQGLLHDYALTIAERTKNGASKEAIDMLMKDMEIRATRELIAHTAEQRVSEAFTQKANRWMKELVGAVRSWLRNNGFAELSKVSTSDIYHIIKQSEKSFRKNELGGYRTTDGGVAFSKKPLYNPNFDTAKQELASKFIGREKSVLDRIKASSIGMTLAHRLEDRFAGLNYIARTMADKMAGMQMMYFNRLYDQRNNMMAEIATHGPVGIVKNADGSFTYKSKEVDSLKTVLEHIKKAAPDIGNAQAAMEQFGLYLAAERAAVVGKEKLSFLENLKEEDLEKLRKDGRANSHFQAARKAYKTYNDGQIDFMVESGRLSKAEGKALKDKGDYVAFYREKNGQIIDEENQITVGNLKNQQYLKELIGGDKPIVSFEEGALQNTYMLTDMAMSNIATKNTAYTLRNLGIAEIKKGDKTGDNIVRFYENGEKMYAELNTNKGYEGIEKRLDKMRAEGKAGTEDFKRLRARAEMGRESSNMFGSIPPELIVKGMEGVSMTLPTAISFMRGPANLLRKAVTRNPAYSARVAFKDSISSWITTGSDVTPVLSALGSIKELMGKETPAGIRSLQEQGIVGGHVFSGTMSDMRDLARKVAGDEKGWEKLWAKADRLAIMADESSRLSLYNGFIKKGLSPMEASLATLESQNFTKHGYSPSIRALSVMIPFFNAQIQGMSTFIRNGLGKSLFEDKLNVKNNLMRRGAMLAGLTLAYTALSQNTEAYKNATEDDKLNYWFIPIPGFKEPIRAPIPFEAGTVFKALPQAVFELAATDAKSKDVLPAISRQILSNVPGMSSMFVGQAFKPALEAATNTDFYSLKPIESTAQLSKKAGYRSYAETTEVSKMLGQNLGISPIQIDHMIKGYTSSTGIALMSMFNPLFASTSSPENKTSQLPIIGQFFQPTDGSGLINKAYDDMTELMKINRTYKELEDTNEKEADRYAEKYAKELDLASAAGAFQRGMGEYNKYEKEVRADNTLTPAQKRKELDAIKKEKIEYAKDFSSSRE